MVTSGGIKHDLTGSMTALVTPFRGGEIDWPAVDALVDRQIDGGTDWVVPCGTTGESPTLSSVEQEKLLERVIARVTSSGSAGASSSQCEPQASACADPARAGDRKAEKRRCRVLAGTGSNSTAETVKKTKQAEQAGADAAMLVAPYYNRPPQEGLFRHYAAVAEAVTIPLVLYNVPGRTGVTISNDTVVRLRERFPNIVAIKDATGVVDNVTEVLGRCDIAVLCGDDVLTWPMMALGAVGVISVISNLVPDLVKSLVDAAAKQDVEAAAEAHRKVYVLANGLAKFGPNPIPIKTAMAVRGLIAEEFRLPLCPVEAPARKSVEKLTAALPNSQTKGVVRDAASSAEGLIARSRSTKRLAPAERR